jgi:CBS domain containing-hemolysin-like protein
MEDVYRGYQTVSGFVMSKLDGIPDEGERFSFHAHEFEIIDMDGHRVDKVLVTPHAEEPSTTDSGAADDGPDGASPPSAALQADQE